MKRAPYVFVGIFAAMAATFWFSVFLPHLQIGVQQPYSDSKTGFIYPGKRPGMAAQGADVYRANGCVTCHSQQINQSGVLFDVVLNKAISSPAMVQALMYIDRSIEEKAAESKLANLPATVAVNVNLEQAQLIELQLKRGDENFEAVKVMHPTGADLERGWGVRRSVALDYLYDYPVFVGSQRLGPDLANVGLRLPDESWHLKHLYYPAALVPGSKMPDYPFLFEKVAADEAGAGTVLDFTSEELARLPEGSRPGDGQVIVAKAEAERLAAYLVSLAQTETIPSAPMPPKPKKKAPEGETNAAPAVASIQK